MAPTDDAHAGQTTQAGGQRYFPDLPPAIDLPADAPVEVQAHADDPTLGIMLGMDKDPTVDELGELSAEAPCREALESNRVSQTARSFGARCCAHRD